LPLLPGFPALPLPCARVAPGGTSAGRSISAGSLDILTIAHRQRVPRAASASVPLASYRTPDLRKSIWQICTSFLPLAAVWCLMVLSLHVGYWLTLLLAPVAAGMLVRVFIIQHDCGHGSFFRSRRANDALGFLCGVLALTPYLYWRRSHAVHHASAGNLAQRGIGDIWTLTVAEYLQLGRWGRLRYRLYRHPAVMFFLGPTLLFVVLYRFPQAYSSTWKRERASVYWTDAAILATGAAMALLIGLRHFLMIQAPITILAASLGTWLFYIQHQFENVYWARGEEWNPTVAALEGSAYYDLPPILRWFTGNIGFHHIHHLDSRIANYNLPRCHRENPQLRPGAVLSLRGALRTIPLALWDEQRRKLVGFSGIRLDATAGATAAF
jgi:omega-6 fatty acid desaturase (delta-12 desaturase)